MRIQCEYCGALIDVKEDDTCPNCGATFDKNSRLHDMMQEEKESSRLKKEEIQLKLESQRLQNEKTRFENELRRKKAATHRTYSKHQKTAAIVIPILAAGIFLSVGVECASNMVAELENYTPPTTEPIVIETPVEVSFGEKASTSTYSVVCDKVEEYYYPWAQPLEGYKYVGVHLVVSNITNEEILSDEPVMCSYKNGEFLMQAEKPTIRSEDWGTKLRNAYIAPSNSIMGKVYFTVPVDADLIVQYGDYITINIPADACVDLPK